MYNNALQFNDSASLIVNTNLVSTYTFVSSFWKSILKLSSQYGRSLNIAFRIP